MPTPTPTSSGLPQRLADFATLTDALDYAAGGTTGLNFYSVRGELTEALPYRELRADALQLARTLLAGGLRPRDRLAVVADTSADFARLFFAAQYAGLIPVPLPLPFAFSGRDVYLAHVRRLAEAAKVSALFAPAALADWVAPLGAEMELLMCGTVAGLRRAPADAGTLPAVVPDDTAYLQFSSGSTRFPMGVVVRHAALMANVTATLHRLEVRPGDRGVSWLPLYHDMGLVGFVLMPLAGQFTVDLLATQDFARRPQTWLSLISANRGTISFAPDFGYDLCTRRKQRAANGVELDLSSWRVAGVGGDMIRAGVLSSFADAFAPAGFSASAFLPSYGMAEATLTVSLAPVGRGIEAETIDLDLLEQEQVAAAIRRPGARTRSVVSCGTVLPGHAVQIRGAGGALLPERREGRIFVRGPSLMQGYDGHPAATEDVLSGDGWLDTGDLGYWLGDKLAVTGRSKDLIIINGRNIWPQDLEWTVEQTVPGVRTGNVAAFSVEEGGGAVLVVAVDPRGIGEPAALGNLPMQVGAAVQAHHGLKSCVVVVPPSSLPYTSSGKLRRSATRQRYLAGTLAPAAEHPA